MDKTTFGLLLFALFLVALYFISRLMGRGIGTVLKQIALQLTAQVKYKEGQEDSEKQKMLLFYGIGGGLLVIVFVTDNWGRYVGLTVDRLWLSGLALIGVIFIVAAWQMSPEE
jgi:hypothetical protein